MSYHACNLLCELVDPGTRMLRAQEMHAITRFHEPYTDAMLIYNVNSLR